MDRTLRSLTTNLALPFETGVNINGNPYPQPHWFLTTSNDISSVHAGHPNRASVSRH